MMWESFNQYLGLVANFIQVGAFIFTLWVLWRTRQRLKRYLQNVSGQSSDRPIALAIGIGDNIEGNVRTFTANQTPPLGLRNYYRSGLLTSPEFYTVLRDVLDIKQELTQLGVSEVHLFYKGPITLAMGIGAVLDNWVPVHLYSFREGKYIFEFILEKGTVLGLMPRVVSEGEEALARQLAP